jgi:hypothetical protein
MFTPKKRVRSDDEKPQTLDRRKVLERLVVGGSALVATTFGGLASTVAAQAEVPQGSAQQQPRGQPSSSAVTRIRLVVTGHNAQGRSHVVSDEVVELKNGGHLWRTSPSEPLGLGSAGKPLAAQGGPGLDPVLGGTRWTIVAMQPSPRSRSTQVNRQGFHRTATVDYIFVLNDAIVLLLDDEEVTLKAGDAVVLRNVLHGWRNEGSVPVRLLSTAVGVGA